jgi:hypothetical protein
MMRRDHGGFSVFGVRVRRVRYRWLPAGAGCSSLYVIQLAGPGATAVRIIAERQFHFYAAAAGRCARMRIV